MRPDERGRAAGASSADLFRAERSAALAAAHRPASRALTSSVTPAAGSWRSSRRSASRRPPRSRSARSPCSALNSRSAAPRPCATRRRPGRCRPGARRSHPQAPRRPPAGPPTRRPAPAPHMIRPPRAPAPGRAARAPRHRPRSALVTTRTSGTSIIPGLQELQHVAGAGLNDDRDGVTDLLDVGLRLAHADGLDHHHVERGRQRLAASRVAAASPPSRPPAAVERISTPSSRGSWSMRARSPSSEPPERLEDGSTASTATVCPLRASGHERGQQRRLPGPGRACYADHVGAGLAAERGGRDLGEELGRVLPGARGSRSRSAPRRRAERSPAREAGAESLASVGIGAATLPRAARGSPSFSYARPGRPVAHGFDGPRAAAESLLVARSWVRRRAVKGDYPSVSTKLRIRARARGDRLTSSPAVLARGDLGVHLGSGTRVPLADERGTPPPAPLAVRSAFEVSRRRAARRPARAPARLIVAWTSSGSTRRSTSACDRPFDRSASARRRGRRACGRASCRGASTVVTSSAVSVTLRGSRSPAGPRRGAGYGMSLLSRLSARDALRARPRAVRERRRYGPHARTATSPVATTGRQRRATDAVDAAVDAVQFRRAAAGCA